MRCYIIELVIKEPPYTSLGYISCNSIDDGELHFARSMDDALIVNDAETMEKCFSLISKHNSDSSRVRVMDWIINPINPNKRIFKGNITF